MVMIFLGVVIIVVAGLNGVVFSAPIDCIRLQDCPLLYNLVLNRQSSLDTLKLLRRLHCGFLPSGQPMVKCLELDSIPCKVGNKIGKCTNFSSCDSIENTSQVNVYGMRSVWYPYIRHPTCNLLNSKYVCCPENKKKSSKSHDIKCGIQDTQKIFGGKNVQFDEFPWTVQLQYQSGTELTRNCGGTLISNNAVITAAHCVDEYALRSVGKLFSIILGEYDTRNEIDCIEVLKFKVCADPYVAVPVKNVTIHPQWKNKPPSTIDHDIAIIRLARTVEFTEYIRPICLPSAVKSFTEGERLTVCGWGQTELEKASPVKLKASIPVTNKEFCTKTYKNTKMLTVGDGEFCVGGEDGIDSCVGDSGGPLMYSSQREGETVWYLAGVVSFGNQPCGVKNYPGLYTHLPKYVDWIQEEIKR